MDHSFLSLSTKLLWFNGKASIFSFNICFLPLCFSEEIFQLSPFILYGVVSYNLGIHFIAVYTEGHLTSFSLLLFYQFI